jgi:hypothetical protein
MDFLDITADEDDDELDEYFLNIGDASSSMFHSISTTSCNSSLSSTSILVSRS